MKTTITLFVLLFSLNTLFSQNWEINQFTQPLKYKSDSTYKIYGINYASETDYYLSTNYYSDVTLDTSFTSNDTSFYVYSNDFLRDTTFQDDNSLLVMNQYMGSIIGSKSFVLTNSDTYFTFRNDSFLIKPKAQLNNSWHFVNYETGDYIEAKIINIDTLSIFNGIDSVKYIELNMKNSSNTTINNIINGVKIILSKNNGLINIPDLRKIKYKILTHTLNSFNYSPLTYGSVYDFEVGDEFHYFTSEVPNIYIEWPEYFHEKRRVIEKTYSQNNDTIYYRVRREIQQFNPMDTISTYPINKDTITQTVYNLNTLITDLKFNSIEFSQLYEYSGNGFTNFSYNRYNNRFVTRIINQTYARLTDSIFIEPILCKNIQDSPLYSRYVYIEGCGKLSNWKFVPDGQAHPYYYRTESLSYYHKGNETWGTPILITENQSIIKNENNIKLFPNPTNGIFTISNTSAINKIEIYNSIGNLIISKNNINNNQTIIDLQNEKAGIYLIKIFSENSYIARKLIKK